MVVGRRMVKYVRRSAAALLQRPFYYNNTIIFGVNEHKKESSGLSLAVRRAVNKCRRARALDYRRQKNPPKKNMEKMRFREKLERRKGERKNA